MLTRKKSIKSRTRRARRQRSKFVTPDLVLSGGKLTRFVAGPDDPLREAERLRGEFAQLVADHDAAVGQFLQRAYFVAVEFRWRLGDFKRFQVHPFWKQTGMKPKDPSTSKWVLYLIMQATTPNARRLADQYAVILDGLMQDQVEVGAVAARIQELSVVGSAYEAMPVRKRGDAQVTGTVAETAAAGRRTRRDDERSPRTIGKSLVLEPTPKRPRRRQPEPTLRPSLVPHLFAGNESTLFEEWLCVENGERGRVFESVPAEAAFDFVQRLAREYAKIKDGDHQSLRRVLARAYLAVLKMQREPGEFERLQADPFWKASSYKPEDPSTSKWVVRFIMQARTLRVRDLAAQYAAILDRLMRDKVSPDDLRIARMEGVEAAYKSVQRRQRLRGSKLWSRRQGGSG